MSNSLLLPPYKSVRWHEGRGNFAVAKYYKFPYRFFYRQKLRMIVNLMDRKYRNILDYGCGPGIFTPELKKHATERVISYDLDRTLDERWNFDMIICASVLEFVPLFSTLRFLSTVSHRGEIIVASPMDTWVTRKYFKGILDTKARHSHNEIIDAVSRYFVIEKVDFWMNMYFALKGKKK